MKTILFFVAALMLTTTAQAKTVSCTIASTKGRIVTVECQGKTISLETGQKVRVKECRKGNYSASARKIIKPPNVSVQIHKKKTRRVLESC